MAQTRQRRREVARAKWERQQARRRVTAQRIRRWRIVGGVFAAIVAVALLSWLVVNIVQQENSTNQPPVVPVPTLQNTPQTGQPPSGAPTTPPSTTPQQQHGTHPTKGTK